MDETPLLEKDAFVRRPWCLWLAIALVVLGAASNTVYLWNHCPLSLSEDESHYWEWSRHLDYGYYSKPPGIAWVIRGAVEVGARLGLNGDGSGAALMPVVRMPAVLFGMMSGLLSLFLARRIFRDDRAALAVTLLSAAVPMFAVGSLLITIDSPMYLCWAGSVFCLWRVVEGGNSKRETRDAKHFGGVGWLYGAGLVCGMGMLFKPVLIAVPICAVIAACADRSVRGALKTWHSLGALALVVASLVPTVVWNARHGWVTFKHIATQGGFVGAVEKESWVVATAGRFGRYLGGQAGGMGGLMFVLLVIAVCVGWRRARRGSEIGLAAAEGGLWVGDRARWVFLLSFAVPLWGFYFLMNFWKSTEANWPAASYFSGMILAAGVFVGGWNSSEWAIRRRWRVWGSVTIGLGILMSVVAMNLQRLYPLAVRKLAPLAGKPEYEKSIYFPGRWDPAGKRLRGFEERAAALVPVIREMGAETGEEPLIVTGRYDTSSSLAFYLPGHPFVYSLMSDLGGRQSQYDLWPGLNERDGLGKLKFAGKGMVVVAGDTPEVNGLLKQSFERVEGPVLIPVYYDGILLHVLTVYRAYGFKGLPEARRSLY